MTKENIQSRFCDKYNFVNIYYTPFIVMAKSIAILSKKINLCFVKK